MKHIFLAGHGRSRDVGEWGNTPPGVTINWAVPSGYGSTNGLSRALLSNTYGTWLPAVDETGDGYREHYLCPDIDFIMEMKARAFRTGNWMPSQDYYLLQPRGDSAIPLSVLIPHLQSTLNAELTLYWTCCRSVIGQHSSKKWIFQGGQVREDNTSGHLVADPVKEGNTKVSNIEDVVTLWCLGSAEPKWEGAKNSGVV